MKLLLSGGGSPDKTRRLDKLFLKLCNDRPILYIPIAKTTRSFGDCYSWISELFSKLGCKNEIIMWTDLRDKSPEDLKKFGGVFIGGGNTFALLKAIKESGFNEIIEKYISSEDIVFYGVSAGALIFGKDISIASKIGDQNTVGLKDLDSMNFLDDSYVWPHYSESQRDRLKEVLSEKKKIITLEEGSGILIEGDKKTKIGEVLVFE